MQKETWPIVLCPGCKGQSMDIKEISSLKADDRQVKLTYRCPRCHFETERVSAPPRPPARAK